MDFKFNSVSATPNNPNWNNLISRQDDLYKKENDGSFRIRKRL